MEDAAAARQSLDQLRSRLDALAGDLSTVLDGLAATASDQLRHAREALSGLTP